MENVLIGSNMISPTFLPAAEASTRHGSPCLLLSGDYSHTEFERVSNQLVIIKPNLYKMTKIIMKIYIKKWTDCMLERISRHFSVILKDLDIGEKTDNLLELYKSFSNQSL